MNHIRRYFADLKTTLDRLADADIARAIDVLHAARIDRRKIFILGNGGSASTASHFVCDLAKNTRAPGWPDFRVLGLSDNMALLSAYANDEGYENVFSQQLASFVQPDDVVIGISTSGNSPNVLECIKLANDSGATTIGFTGFDGGHLAQLVDIDLYVPSRCIEQVEDIHLMLEHLICSRLREQAITTSPILSNSEAGRSSLSTVEV